MRRKITLSPTARRRLDHLLDYLEEKWFLRVKREFIKKLEEV